MSGTLKSMEDRRSFTVGEVQLTRAVGDVDGDDAGEFLTERLGGDCGYVLALAH